MIIGRAAVRRRPPSSWAAPASARLRALRQNNKFMKTDVEARSSSSGTHSSTINRVQRLDKAFEGACVFSSFFSIGAGEFFYYLSP